MLIMGLVRLHFGDALKSRRILLFIKQPTMLSKLVLPLPIWSIFYTKGVNHNVWGNYLLCRGLCSPSAFF